MIGAPTQGALERRLGALLGGGTWLASAVIAAGLLWPASWPLSGGQVVMAGVATLILLPVLRVVLMLLAFVRGRDYRFAAVAGLVLAIIGSGLLAGLRAVPH
jgi:uncharacterized membrane protein